MSGERIRAGDAAMGRLREIFSGGPAPEKVDDAGVPAVIGRFKVLRRVAVGASGQVYEADDLQLGRRVAVKVLHADTSEALIRRFQQEATLAARMQHPGIVAIHETSMIRRPDGLPMHFIVMDFHDRTLQDLLERPDFGRAERLKLLEAVARAVQHAHEAGVIHRDLKPANILVARDGRPVVSDFGLARDEAQGNLLTRSGTPLGTPSYMSPEQVSGDLDAIGPPSDVYSLGVMLYQLLTNALPFSGASLQSIFAAILGSEAQRPTQRDPSISRELETICLKAIDKEPRRRYADAGSFAEDLRRAQAGEPILARPETLARRFLRKLRRSTWARAAAAGMLIGGVAILAAVTLLSGPATKRRAADGHAREAALAYARGDLAAAKADAERALAELPDHAEARFWQARVKLRDYQSGRGVPEIRSSYGLIRILPPPPETTEQQRLRREIQDAFRGNTTEAFAAGVLAMWDGRYAEAIEAFAKADAAGPAVAWEARVLKAQCAYSLLRFDEAEATLRPQLGLDPRLIDLTWGRLMVARGLEQHLQGRNVADVFALADAAGERLERAGATMQGAVLRARVAIELAAADLRRGIDPTERLRGAARRLGSFDSVEAHLACGDIAMLLAQYRRERGMLDLESPLEPAKAIAFYTRAAEVRKDYAVAWHARASAHRFLRDYREDFGRATAADLDRVISDERMALACLPGFADAAMDLAAAEALKERGDEADAARTRAAYEKEIEAVGAVIARESGAPGYLRRAELQETLAAYLAGRGPDIRPLLLAAMADSEKAISLHPAWVEALRARSAARLALARHDGITLRQDPAPQYEQALQDLVAAVKINPFDAGLYDGLSNVRRNLAKLPVPDGDAGPHFEAGLKDLEKAIEIQPNWPGHVFARAYLRRDYGSHLAVRGLLDPALVQFKEALADLDEALRLNPRLMDAYRVRAMTRQRIGGLTLQRGGDPEPWLLEAIADGKAAIAVDPACTAKHYNIYLTIGAIRIELAGQHQRRGSDPSPDFQQALVDLSTGIGINPSYANLYRLRGTAHAGLGAWRVSRGLDARSEKSAAIEDLQKAMALDSSLTSAIKPLLDQLTD